MAQIDTSIYGRFAPTVKLQTPFEIEDGYQQIQQRQNQNKLSQMQFQKAERDTAQENALAGAYKNYYAQPNQDANMLYKSLADAGQGSAIPGAMKSMNDAASSGVELGNKRLTGQKLQGDVTHDQKSRAIAKLGGFIQDPGLSEDMLMTDLQFQVQSGELKIEQAQGMASQIQGKTPEQLRQLLTQLRYGMMTPQQQVDGGDKNRNNLILPDGSVNEQLVGAKSRVAQAGVIQSFGAPTAVTDPKTGKQIMVSAGNRGDIKELPYSPPVKQNKPLPVGALKLRVESQEMADIAGGINDRLTGVESRIAEGKLSFGPVSNLSNKALNLAGMSTENSRNFASFKAELEKLRNDSLRLNKGVQTDGDSQRAWNEILENITDTKLVQQRVAEVKILNERAKNLRLMEVDTINRNYGVENEQPAGNTKPPAGKTATTPAPQGAIDLLRKDPSLGPKFKAKYGYLP